MDKNLEKIVHFIREHHVLSLATSDGKMLSSCNLFFAYGEKELSFVVASSDDTTHIGNILKHPEVAGSIVLETKTVTNIQGLQFRGVFSVLQDNELKKLYFKTFPFSIALSPKLWKIKVDYFKLTDNTLGFGKKIIWQEAFL
ncbi:MAG: pyridoxamine 5'-phosphate oxidase family protein [Sulfurimonas sp.]|nr:pyridoxamine 5'-phosphate oxidase family protein [Sulfurimonas sp.]